MPGNHKCPKCKVIYACCADECPEHYSLKCTPCEIKEYDKTHTLEQKQREINNFYKKCDAILAGKCNS